MVRADELQAIGFALGALSNLHVQSKGELEEWYSQAQELWEKIKSNSDISNVMPHVVWHYLSDADIRLKDKRYADLQCEEIEAVIKVLKRGQVP